MAGARRPQPSLPSGITFALQTCVRNTERSLDMAGKLLESDLSLAYVKADAVLATQIVWDTVLK